MTTPFIIYALPRSRTAWLSAFLTYGEWECYHECAIFMRSMEDVKAFFSSKNIGCVETAAVQGRCLIKSVCPDIKEVVILRPVDDVVNSLLNIDLSGVATYDKAILQRNMEYGDRMLRKIAKDKDVLVINYSDLQDEAVCANIFEFCLPYQFDKQWYESLKNKNIQVDVKAFFRYYQKHKQSIEDFKKHCKSELFKLCRKKVKYA